MDTNTRPQTTQENKDIEIEHIKEETWERIERNIRKTHRNHTLTKTSKNSKRSTTTPMATKNPQITNMLPEDYTQNDTRSAIKALKKNKAHGSDGIPEEAYKATQTWIIEPITQMLNEIKNGKQLPTEWKNGAVVHIYKK